MIVAGLPTGAAAWRRHVAAHVDGLALGDGVELAFRLPAGRWVDVDTIAESTLAGLRDAGVLAARFAGLDAVLATKVERGDPGVTITAVAAASLSGRRAPGRVDLDVAVDAAPRPSSRQSKHDWRDALTAAWGDRPLLAGPVWADVAMATGGSLLSALEVVLDALEPVLGRDPRGRDWQTFFPNDHVIDWLRVRREPRGPALRVRLGPRR